MIDWQELIEKEWYTDERLFWKHHYTESDLGVRGLQQALGWIYPSYTAMLARLQYLGIPIKSRGGPRVKPNPDSARQRIRVMAGTATMTSGEVAAKIGCSHNLARNYLSEFKKPYVKENRGYLMYPEEGGDDNERNQEENRVASAGGRTFKG